MALHSQVDEPIHAERHYTVLEVAKLWNLSPTRFAIFFNTR